MGRFQANGSICYKGKLRTWKILGCIHMPSFLFSFLHFFGTKISPQVSQWLLFLHTVGSITFQYMTSPILNLCSILDSHTSVCGCSCYLRFMIKQVWSTWTHQIFHFKIHRIFWKKSKGVSCWQQCKTCIIWKGLFNFPTKTRHQLFFCMQAFAYAKLLLYVAIILRFIGAIICREKRDYQMRNFENIPSPSSHN